MTFSVSLRLLAAAALLTALPSLPAQTPTLTVDAKTIVSPVSPMLYGLMTEEINHSYEGGLYGELVDNRTFRAHWDGIGGWGLVRNGNAHASYMLDKTTGPSAALPTGLKLTVTAASAGNEAGVSNSGFWGMAVRPRTRYSGSFYSKAGEDNPGPVTAQLINNDSGAVLAEARVDVRGGAWARYGYTLMTGAMTASSRNHLQFTVAKSGTLWLQQLSLFPPTYKNRANGNRVDLMEMMAAMHPKFLRLPGGNYLEGDTLADRYDFKKTIGPLVDRPGHQAPWTYWSTDGLGFLEFLEWCEDLNIEPILAVYAGYALKGYHVPAAELGPYIQDALDEVEYVTGDVTTKWGAQRAKDGHPAPFPLHYIEIGNEDWLDHSGSYKERWPAFAKALRAKYPQYKLIATEPIKDPVAGTEPDVVDDHYYKSPAEMFDLVHRYDTAPRNGPKIFVGEWATRSGTPTPNFGDALGDAAWMTSMERNADLITLSAYAPMLTNVNPGALQWNTDLIGYDAMRAYGSPSYYAQALFAGHVGDEWAKSSAAGVGERFFYSATVDSQAKMLHLKLVNASNSAQPLMLTLDGVRAGAAKVTTLHAASFQATNSIAAPEAILPVESKVAVKAGSFAHDVPAFTIEVIDVLLK